MSSPDTPGTQPAAPAKPLTGILILLAAVVCFACMDASAKWLGRSTSPMMTASVRYIVSFLLVIAFINPRKTPGLLHTSHPWLQLARGACLIVTTLCVFISLRYLPLTQLTAIAFGAPLLVALLAGPVLGERIGPRRVIAVLAGFGGVLTVTRPFNGSLQPAAFLAFAGAVSSAFYSLVTRRLAGNDKPETTMFYTSAVGTVVAVPALPFVWHTPGDPWVYAVLGLLGVFGAIGHWLLILAHRHTPASTLAPFFYTQIIGAGIFGVTLFGETPDRWTILGTAIVVGSGLYLLYRERVRRSYPSADLSG